MDEDYKSEPDVSSGEQFVRFAAVAGMIGFVVLVAAMGVSYLLEWAGQYATKTVFTDKSFEISAYRFNRYGIRLDYRNGYQPISVGLGGVRLDGDDPVRLQRHGDVLWAKLSVLLAQDSTNQRGVMWWRFDSRSGDLRGCTKAELGAPEEACAEFAAQMP